MKKRNLILLLLSFCVYASAYANDYNDSLVVDSAEISQRRGIRRLSSEAEGSNISVLNNLLPQSPQAAQLARYGQYPVNHTTGVPDITIPIYEIKLGNFTLPISISYHASGIKMYDVASTVGLGWSLNAGGVITRSVCGAVDLQYDSDTQYYDYDTLHDLLTNNSNSTTEINAIAGDKRDAQYDTQSDIYTFNFAGHTGMFRYSLSHQKYIPINYDKMKIEATPESGYRHNDSSFTIVDTNGYTYFFELTEQTGVRDDESKTGVSAWYLTKIYTPNGIITINYDYTPFYTMYMLSEMMTTGYFRNYDYDTGVSAGNGMHYEANQTEYLFRIPVVSSITWKGNTIRFNYSDDRRDIWKTRLTNIEVINSLQEVVKSVSFNNNDYWGNDALNYRMKLNSVTVSDEGDYIFTYNTNGCLPKYHTNGYRWDTNITSANPMADYWGYYNGTTARSGITQQDYWQARSRYNPSNVYNSSYFANRAPSEYYTKLGIIKSIKYPTGGHTNFEFELNDYGCGGLRIKKITNYDANNEILESKEYTYSGSPSSDDPSLLMSYDAYHCYSSEPFPGSSNITNNIVCVGEPMFPLTYGSGVFYDEIIEKDSNGDYIVYNYSSDPIAVDQTGHAGNGHLPQLIYTAVNDYGSINPLLISKRYYDDHNNLLQTETYEYENDEVVNYSAGNKVVSLIRSYSAAGGYFSDRIAVGNMVNNHTIRYDSVMVHSRVCHLKKKTITDEMLDASTTEEYTYDSNFNTNSPKTHTVINSDSRRHTTEYEYAFEKLDSTIFYNMIEANMYDEIIGVKKYCNGTLLASNGKSYYDDFFLPKYEYETIYGGGTVEKYHYASYDNECNLTSLITKGYDKDSIEWDATQSYPIKHYMNSRLKTCYSWKPLVGLASTSAENGFITTYSYDGASRLESISDHYGCRQRFSYNYVNSNVQHDVETNYVKSIAYLTNTGDAITTYKQYDDIGRPTHEATNGLGGNGLYTYTFMRYDNKSRVVKKSLPAVGSASFNDVDSVTQASFIENTYAGEPAIQEMNYDGIDRVISVTTPGAAWCDAGKSIGTEYVTNAAGSVRLFHAPMDQISLVDDGMYPAKTLYGVKTTDEDGHSVIIFKDKIGRKILERRETGANSFNDTYFVYNDLGQLRYVLTPEYQNAGYKSMYAYEYRYDGRGNLVKKIIPQCEYEQYWYDKTDNMVFMQDAILRERGRYRFMLYDTQGRQVVQGTCSSCVRSFNGIYSYPRVSYSNSDSGILGTGYTLNCSGLVTNPEIEIVNYYDDYAFVTGSSQALFTGLTYDSSINTTGMLTGQIVALSDGTFSASVKSYDDKGQLLHNSMNISGKREDLTTTYSFTGQPLVVSSSITTSGGLSLLNVCQTNSYNLHNDKIAETVLQLSSGGFSASATTSRFTYDNLGRLVSLERPDSAGVVNYSYNIHGWPTLITTPSLTENLYYTDGLGTPCYNGNVSSMTWQNRGYNSVRGYRFTYDKLDRLTESVYGEGTSLTNKANRYNEKIVSYNANGAIKRLQRRGKKQDGEYGKIDNLNITLEGNRPLSIVDDALPVFREGTIDFVDDDNTRSTEYTYNGNGALTSDSNKGIAFIEYDNWGNPKRIQFSNGNLTEYVYTALGEKRKVIHKTAVPDIVVPIGMVHELTVGETLCSDSTEYLLDGALTIKDGRLDKYIFGNGYCTFGENQNCSTTNSSEASLYFYNKDHLGNVREVVDTHGNVEQIVHYYPSGTPFTDGSGEHPDFQEYLYSGKELDKMHGLNTYDHGARQYDPILMRWDRVDRLCEKYYSISPYAYCMGNPINRIDPDGKDVWLFATKLPGTILGTDYHVPFATHTFLVVTGDNGKVLRYAAYGPDNGKFIGGDKLTECHYQQDQQVYTDFFKGIENNNLKGKPQKVNVPKNMTSEEFDKKVIQTINCFGNQDGITYNFLGGCGDKTSGNCNSSSSTILIKSGVGRKEMESLERNIEGINTGFQISTPKPWTKEEQEKALDEKKNINRLIAL